MMQMRTFVAICGKIFPVDKLSRKTNTKTNNTINVEYYVRKEIYHL